MRTIAAATSQPFKMTKGEQPFDLTAVQNALKTVQEHGSKFRDMFPDNSKTGGDTDAPAKIWTDRAGFNAAIDKWVKDAAATAAAIKDEATFKTEYPKFAGGCNNCHKATDGYAISLQESFKKPKP
jgi:cytochrome c556